MGLPQNKNIQKSFDGIVVIAKQKTQIAGQAIAEKNIHREVRQAVLVSAAPDPTVVDDKKRMFLRLAGMAGIGTIAAMLLPKKAQAYVMGGSPTSGVVGIKDANNKRITPAQESAGNLDQINANTAPFLNSTTGGYVQQNTVTPTIALETGGNLAAIATNLPMQGQAKMAASMPVTIASDQSALPVSASFSGNIGLKDTTNTQVNPSTDDSLTYLRRMVKLLEPMGTVDIATRQRISIDTFPGGVATLPTYTAGATLPTVTTVGAVTGITNALPTGANFIGGITNMTFLAGQNQQMYQDVARNAFASGIRQNLSWT